MILLLPLTLFALALGIGVAIAVGILALGLAVVVAAAMLISFLWAAAYIKAPRATKAVTALLTIGAVTSAVLYSLTINYKSTTSQDLGMFFFVAATVPVTWLMWSAYQAAPRLVTISWCLTLLVAVVGVSVAVHG